MPEIDFPKDFPLDFFFAKKNAFFHEITFFCKKKAKSIKKKLGPLKAIRNKISVFFKKNRRKKKKRRKKRRKMKIKGLFFTFF